MSVPTIPVTCYYNGQILRSETDVKYEGSETVIEPLQVPVACTFQELIDMIYLKTTIDKRRFKLVLICKYPLRSGKKFQPYPVRDDSSVRTMLDLVNTPTIEEIELYIKVVRVKAQVNQSVGGHADIYVRDNSNVAQFDYGCGPSSGPVPDTGPNGDDEDNADEERNDEYGEDVDDESDGDDGGVEVHRQASFFRAFSQVLENEQGIYVSAQAPSCDVSNHLDDETLDEPSPVTYHLPPTPHFEHVENLHNAVASNWTPWVEPPTANSSGEFVIGQVFNSKSDLQEAAKIYSIKAHQEYVVVASSKKLLVLRCKKAEECQCQWKLRAMVIKDTSLFVINKYIGPHTCVNPCLNRDHHQLDSQLVSTHIKALIQAQFSLSTATIQASVMEKWGYQISYKKALDGKHKAIRQLYGDFSQSYTELPRLFLGIEQANPGCAVVWKTCETNMPNTEIFQRVFWSFKPSIEGFQHCRPVMSIDGTHLYGKYKGKLLIAMGCDANNQLFPLAFAITEGENTDSWGWFLACIRNEVTQRAGICVISDRHPGIMAAMVDPHLGWATPFAYHRICMRHFASNFMTRFKDKILKNLVCRAALASTERKFKKHMNTIGRINSEALQWLEAVPFQLWALSHDGGRRYGLMTTNISEVFNSVLKGARSLPVTALVQLTFFRLNSYFVARREVGANRLASSEQFTPFVDAQIQGRVVKAGSMEIVLYDHVKGLFHVKSKSGRTHRVNLNEKTCTCVKTLIYGFPCSHIISACQHRCVDFRLFVEDYYTTKSYYGTWAPLFHPIFNKDEWPLYNGTVILPPDSMRRFGSGRPKSTRLHNKMDVREGKTLIRCGVCKQLGHNRRSCKNINQAQ